MKMEKKAIVKDMVTGKEYETSKSLDYLVIDFKRADIKSVCVKIVEDRNTEKLIEEIRKDLEDNDYY